MHHDLSVLDKSLCSRELANPERSLTYLDTSRSCYTLQYLPYDNSGLAVFTNEHLHRCVSAMLSGSHLVGLSISIIELTIRVSHVKAASDWGVIGKAVLNV